MKKLVLLMLVAVAAFAANAVMVSGAPFTTFPHPPAEYEFYWDDGILANGWAWYTGGNYWATQFDDAKTGGDADGGVKMYGSMTYPNWPDATYQGHYMHTFDDLGGYPGSDLDGTYCQHTTGGSFEWWPPGNSEACVQLTTSIFYIAWEQYGNYPVCDSMAVDSVSGTHNWTGYNGSWSPTTLFGDFMLRCYWEEDGCPVVESSWGAVKALY